MGKPVIRVGSEFETYVESVRKQLELQFKRKVSYAEATNFIAGINRGAATGINIEITPVKGRKRVNFFGY